MLRVARLVVASALVVPGALQAQDDSPLVALTLGEALRDGTPLLQVRPRYTWVDQDGQADDAYWTSVRTTLGWQTLEYRGFSATAELINVGRMTSDNGLEYSDGPGAGSWGSGWAWWSGMGYARGYYPLVQDPNVTDINRLYLEYLAYGHTSIRGGRQTVSIDNQRFIGDYDFGQLPQTLDGVTLDSRPLHGARLLYGYYAHVRNAYDANWDASINAVNLQYEFLPLLKVAGYGYFQNQTTTGSVTGFEDNSNKIYGGRVWGGWRMRERVELLYSAELAEQRNLAGGDERIDATYQRYGAGLQIGPAYARVDWEQLGSNQGLYGFQTPLGSTQLFTGRADLFATTPAVGLEDLRGTLGADIGPVRARLEFHSFQSDYRDWDLGHEWDVGLSWRIMRRLTASVDYADYQAGDEVAGLRDTQKVWVTLDFKL